jgi:hypothetical protein
MTSTEGTAITLAPGRVATPRYVDGELLGFAITHPCKSPEHTNVGAWIPTHGIGDHSWKLVCLEPLTISPSLACRVCGDHGFVRDGKYWPA